MAPRRRSTSHSYLARRRRNRALLAVLVVLLIVAAAADRLGVFGYSGDDWRQFDQQSFLVARVLDGDTIEIATTPAVTRVRLIGIDAPEMNYRSELLPEHWAQESTDYLRRRIEGRSIVIRLDPPQTRDRYGRLLAYVYVSDSENLNQTIVREGHARADRRFSHSLRPQFEVAESEARNRRRGLWAEPAASPRSDAGVRTVDHSPPRSERSEVGPCMISRRSPPPTNAICVKALIVAQQINFLDLRLRDQQPVERIAVAKRQVGNDGIPAPRWRAT